MPKKTDDNTPDTDAQPDDVTSSRTADQGTGDASHENSLPEWAQKELQEVRAEAARRRVELRELREELAARKSPEEVAAMESRLTELELTLSRERLARKYDLPEVLAKRIQGATEEERDADAKALAEALPKAVHVSGGLDPTKNDGDEDPKAIAARIPRRY